MSWSNSFSMKHLHQRGVKGLAICLLLGLALLIALPSKAQTATGTIPTGTSPIAVAVNPITNTVYVANSADGSVTVINGEINTTATVTVGTTPNAVAVNPVTNQIYVMNGGSGSVTVIDGATNLTATVTVGTLPFAVAVNPVTNKIYVANSGSNDVTVIDGATNSTATVGVGSQPDAVAVNPVTNQIYVANFGGGAGTTVTVIDGATNATSPVTVGTGPTALAVNPVTNKIYVANRNSTNVTVIDGATNSTATVSAGSGPFAVAVNPVTNQIYVANLLGNTVTVIAGATNSTSTVGAGTNPFSIALNPVTNQIYVTNENSTNVTVINGATNSTATVTTGTTPQGVAVNPVTDRIYVADSGSGNVTVIDGATNIATTVTDVSALTPRSVAINPVTNKIYVANGASNNVTVINGTTSATTTVGVGTAPVAVAINPTTNKIYVANLGSNNVTVIDGATNSTSTVAVGTSPQSLAVNQVTNQIYVSNSTSNNVTVIDGATDTTTTVGAGNSPGAIAVDPVLNKIYVVNTGVSTSTTIIDGATNATTTVTVGSNPVAVAVNPVTNKAYVASFNGGNVTVIDGATNSTTTVTDSGALGPQAVAVNSVTNKIYVANNASATVTVIDAATNTTVSIPILTSVPVAVAVNPVTNKTYVVTQVLGGGFAMVIDGATNSKSFVTVGNFPQTVAVNPMTNQVWVTNNVSNNVTVINEGQVQAIPLQAAITPLAGNTTTSPTPSFTFTASSTFSPTATTPNSLLFQLDSWQGPWQVATNGGSGNFSGTTPTLQLGFHILYAYSTDGQDATSTNTGSQSSPLISNIAAYGFLVNLTPTAPVFSPSPSPLAFGNQLVGAASTPQTETVTNIGTANLSITSAVVSGANAADFATSADTCTGATVAPDTSCSINVTFTPSVAGAEAATLNFTDNAAGSPQAVSLSGTGLGIPVATLSSSSLSFSAQGVGTTSSGQNLTLSNTGTVALTITSISASGDFAQSNNCGSSVAVGASCSLSITFTPTAAGARTGSITITDDASPTTQIITLTGTGVLPAVTLSASSLTFPVQDIGTTSPSQTVTLTNSGTATLKISSISPSGDFAVTHNCGATVVAGANCALSITFTPTAAGARTGSITITDNASPATQTISLSGTGVLAQLTVSPTTLSLPGTHINQTCTPGTVTVTNISSTAVGISNVGISGPFVVSANTCPLAPATLAAGASCTVSVTYVPTAVATQTGTLTITSNASNSPNIVALTAVGLPACFLAPNVPAAAVMRGSASASFTVAHQACSAAGPVHLSCSNQSPATCAFSPDTLTSPDMSSTLTVNNLQALTSDLKFQVHADAALEHLYTGLSVDLMDFMMASAAASGNINAGQTASYALAVASNHGLQGTVSFSCSGAPAGATCTVTPQSVTLNETGSSAVAVKVATTARSMVAPPATRRMLPPGTNPLGLLLLGLMALLASMLVWTKARALAPARLRWATLAAGLIVAMVLTWAACGGTAVSPVSSNPMGTPSGTFNLTVTGTYSATGSSALIVHNTTLTLTVH